MALTKDQQSPVASESAADSDFTICNEICSALERDRKCLQSNNKTESLAPCAVRSHRRRGIADAESEHGASNYMSRTDITSASSGTDSSSSEDEKVLAQYASLFTPLQQATFIANARGQRRAAKPVRSNIPVVNEQGAVGSGPSSKPPICIPAHRSAMGRRGGRRRPFQSRAYERGICIMRVMQKSVQLDPAALLERQGEMWAIILPHCVSGFLDLKSITRLRRACLSLYYGVKYSVSSINFDFCCTFTEPEIINDILPKLGGFLTNSSFSQMNFSRCCLLTDSFPKALINFEDKRLCRQVRSLIFDYCYALSDKSLETLLSTPLPHLEVLSLRCARSRDLTGAPFSSTDLLSKERWPRFHQLSCSCTQITLPHLDAVSRFLAERAIHLGRPPKLGISGSLASHTLLRRLGLEAEHRNFVDAIVNEGTVAAVEAALMQFESKWFQNIDEGENKHRVLNRLVRSRWSTILVNAPCSVAIVDDGDGHEKAMWLLLGRRQSGNTSKSVAKDQSVLPSSPNKLVGGTSSCLANSDQSRIICGCCSYQGVPPYPTISKSSLETAPPTLNEAESSQIATSRVTPVPDDVTFMVQPNIPPIITPIDTTKTQARDSVKENTATENTDQTILKSSTQQQSKAASTNVIAASDPDEVTYVKQANYTRWTYPLPIAIRLGILPIVRYLLQRGAYCDVWGYNFATPLYIAVSNCLPESTAAAQEKEPVEPSAVELLPTENKSYCNDVAVPPSSLSSSSSSSSSYSSSSPSSSSSITERNKISSEPVTPTSDIIDFSIEHVVLEENLEDTAAEAQNVFEDHGSHGMTCAELITDDGLCRLGSDNVTCACPCHRSVDEIHADRGSRESYKAIVDLLLEAGAQVDAPDLYSIKCPVNAAVKNDNVEMLETLVRHGACINVRTLPPNVIPPGIELSRRPHQKKLPQRGLTRLGYKSPLFLGCELDSWHCVAALLDHGADPHCRDPFSNRNVTPAMLAYRKRPGAGSTKETRWVLSEILAASILQDDIETIGFLVSLYPDLLERESSGMWSLPLIQAARLNKVLVLQTLLGYGACPNAINTEGLAALHLAASEGHRQTMECLLLHGAEPNIQGGFQKKTPLHIAVEENRKDVVEILLNYKADITIKNSDGMTPLMTAIASRNDKVAVALIERANATELDICDVAGRTPLMYAIYYGQFKVADNLVAKGVTCRATDISGATAESMLKQKIQSLGKTTSSNLTINKILRNIVGAGTSQPPTTAYRSKDAESATIINTSETANVSDESVRKLNAKRKKIAKRLLKQIRAKSKKDLQQQHHAISLSTTPAPTISSPLKVQKQSVEIKISPPVVADGRPASARIPPSGDSPLSTPQTQNSELRMTNSQQVAGEEKHGFYAKMEQPPLDCSWNNGSSSSIGEEDDELSSVSSSSSESFSSESAHLPS